MSAVRTERSSPRAFDRADLFAALALFVALAILFWRLFRGELPSIRDLPRFLLPSRSLWASHARAGALDLWNPWVSLGVSTASAPVHGTFYPLHLLLLLGPIEHTLPWCLLLHAVWAGLGGHKLARALGARDEVALMAALPWALGGYAISMWGAGEKVMSGAWIPWVAVAVLSGSKTRSIVGAAIALAMIALAGDPFLWPHALSIAIVAALVAERSWRSIAIALVGAVALGALLSAASWVPALAVMSESERAGGLSADEALRWSTHPIRALEWLAPNALGDPWGGLGYRGARWVGDDELGPIPWAPSIYAGAAMLPLVVRARLDRGSKILWALVLVASLAALGAHMPGLRAIVASASALRLLRYPEKHLLVAIAALGLLAARGSERAIEAPNEARARSLAVMLIAWLPLPFVPRELADPLLRGLVHATIASSVVLFCLERGARSRALLRLAPAVVAVDLIVSAARILPWTSVDFARSPPPLAAAALAGGQRVPVRVYRTRHDGALATLAENVGVLHHLAQLPGHDPAIPLRVHRLWDAVAGDGFRAASLLDLRWFLLSSAEADTLPSTLAVARDADDVLVSAPHPHRVTLADDVAVLDDVAALALLAAPSTDPVRTAVVAPSPAAHPIESRSTSSPGRCDVESFTDRLIVASCVVVAPSLALVREAWAPGWSAEIDGAAATIERADVALRGLYLQPGTHRLAMRFTPPGLRVGVALSLLGCAIVAFATARATRRRA
ncbi:MAG: hypothetical protein ACHREM_19045 [Polyangiales bacterium]